MSNSPFPVLRDIKVGDRMIRTIGAPKGIETEVIVTKIKGAVISVTIPPERVERVKKGVTNMAKGMREKFFKGVNDIEMDLLVDKVPEWTFSMNTGAEIDIELGWDGIATGSFLSKPKQS